MIKNFEEYINEDYFSKLASRKDNGINRKDVRGPKAEPIYYEQVYDKYCDNVIGEIPFYKPTLPNFKFNTFYCPNGEDIYGGYLENLDIRKNDVLFVDNQSSSHVLSYISDYEDVVDLANVSGFFSLEDLEDNSNKTFQMSYDELGTNIDMKRFIGKYMITSAWTSYDFEGFNEDILSRWYNEDDFVKESECDWFLDGVVAFKKDGMIISLPSLNSPKKYTDDTPCKIELIKNIIKITSQFYIENNFV